MTLGTVVRAPSSGSPWRRRGWYVFAVAVTVLTGLVGYAIDLGRGAPVGFEPFLIPVALSAVLGGVGPGIVAVITGVLGGFVWTVSNMITVWGPWEWFGLVAGGLMLVLLFDRVRTASAALAVAESRNSAILAAAMDAIITIDERHRIATFNASAERIFGWKASEVVGKPLAILVPERLRADHENMVRGFSAAVPDESRGMGFIRTDIEGLRANGEEFPLETSISRVEVEGEVVLTAMVRDLTERRRAEEALRDRDFKLSLFLRNAPASMAMYDRDLRVLLASDQWAKDMGLGDTNVHGKLLSELLPHMSKRWNDIHAHCLAGAAERGDNERIVRPDGRTEWFSWEMRPWHTPSGDVGGIISMGWETTGQRRAIDALRASEERWRTLVETLPEALLVFEDYRVVFANEPGLQLWRAKSAQELIGRSVVELVHPDYRRLMEVRAADPDANKGSFPLWELRITALDGTTIPVEATGRVRTIDGHRVAQVIVRDISRRKAAEEQLRFQEALLREMGRMAHVGGWTVDVETGNQFWTEEMPRIFDKGPTSPMTMEDRLAMFDGEAKEQISAAVDGVLREGRSYELEVPLVTATGNHKWIRSIGQPMIEDDKVVGIRAACQDVTEQHLASERIHRMNEDLETRVEARTAELKAANRELEAFSYSVSHDLRAPLRTMDGFAGILQSDFGDQLPPDAVRCIRVIRESAQRMGNLIDDLLAFSRLGREKLRPVEVDMRALVDETLGELRPTWGDRHVEIDVGAMCPCRGDKALLKQVWTNLLANALKYTRPRHTARITVGCEKEDGTGAEAFFVRDNGVGFDMKYADKLFGVFQRLHRVTDFEGTGVGLAIVQRVVSRHGGRVWCEAEEGHGATFHFTIATEAEPGEAAVGSTKSTQTDVVTAA